MTVVYFQIMTDICKPPLMWLGGRCYRMTGSCDLGDCEVTPGYTGEDEGELLDQRPMDDMEDSLLHDIQRMDNGNYRAVLKISSAFFPQIIGKGGQTKTRLEIDTKTKIVIPRKGQEGDIIVTGVSRNGVLSACNRIDVTVASSRQRQPFTHFISLPVNEKHIQEAFLQFKSDVLSSCQNVKRSGRNYFPNRDSAASYNRHNGPFGRERKNPRKVLIM